MNSSGKPTMIKKMSLVTNERGQVKKKCSKLKNQTIVFTTTESRPGKKITAATRMSPWHKIGLNGRYQDC
jgi:hypothetical protein